MEKTIDIIKLVIATIGAFISSWLGGFDKLLQFYLVCIVCDLVFGAFKGIKKKEFSSSVLFWGFMNKVIALVAIGILDKLDEVLSIDLLRNTALIWFCICEGASLLENFAILGLPIPDGLRNILTQVKKGFSINFTKIVKQIIDNYKVPIENEDSKDGEKHD